MAGIYIHIPFCRQACHYCNFHFSTSLNAKSDLVSALVQEVQLRRDYLGSEKIETIYLGGGTPSLLEESELSSLMSEIARYYSLAEDVEITLEANPDDLTTEKFGELKRVGINRLSIGVQSFDEEDLQWMNRSHNVEQAEQSIAAARDAGFDNLSVDLIFGCPTTTTVKWEKNLVTLNQQAIPHLSCYGLTIEEKTALAHQVKNANGPRPDEKSNAEQFEMTMAYLSEVGYEQYEISNYAKDNKYSRHNTNYWKQVPYLGIGPSAHSFNGVTRQWNVASNPKYIKALQAGNLPYEMESLDRKDQFNEYLLTSLRTIWGCDMNKLEKDYSEFLYAFSKEVSTLVRKGQLLEIESFVVLTDRGKMIADQVISDLFAV